METGTTFFRPRGRESFEEQVLEAYKSSDESARMDIYMTYRELREEFEKLEAETTLIPSG